MNTIPQTSSKHYLTGQAALNIPTENGDFADWHFSAVFLSGKGRFAVAGQDTPDTSSFFGDYGIREVSPVLRRYGVDIPPGKQVYAANFVRATLDLVVKSILQGNIPHHVTLHDTLDTAKVRNEFHWQLRKLRQHITDQATLLLLDRWEQEQQP